MADITAAIDFVLRQEDSELKGEVTNIGGDRGGRTRFGVAERAHPELTPSGFYDKMPVPQALAVARNLYQEAYANKLQLGQIWAQSVANALLSFAVNQGTEHIIHSTQRALGVTEDGIFGPETLKKLNAVPAETFLKVLKTLESDYYMRLVASDSTQSKFFRGWMARVRQNCTICST